MNSDKTIELKMSNITQEPVDLVHRVVSLPDTVWQLPYNAARSYVDQVHNYKKYSNFLSNMLYLEAEPYETAYKELLARAEKEKKLVFECTCFPGPCHMDVIREKLTKDLEYKGFKVVSNQGPINVKPRSDDDD